jgi:hypothetical protein
LQKNITKQGINGLIFHPGQWKKSVSEVELDFAWVGAQGKKGWKR